MFADTEKEIFRKVSLERLSSPEQLDSLMEVTTPRAWIALVALCIVLVGGLVWGFAGRTDITVTGRGILSRPGGVDSVVSLAPGTLQDILVSVGDHVEQGQVVAHVAQPAYEEQLVETKGQMTDALRARETTLTARTMGDAAHRLALQKQADASRQEIAFTQDQIKFAREQIPVDEQLLAKGLITKQTAINDQQKVSQLESNIQKLNAQIFQLESEQVALRNSSTQAGLEQTNHVNDINRNLASMQQQYQRSSQVVSSLTGRVVEVVPYRGAMLAAGQPILNVEPMDGRIAVFAYISAAQAKEIRPDMEVHISPSGVEREEFGYLRGNVISVAQFPATYEAILRTFENESIAKSMMGNGSVQGVLVRLQRTADDSGYVWSSNHGPATPITSGSFCTVEVVTRKQHPIELLLPYLKKKTGIS